MNPSLLHPRRAYQKGGPRSITSRVS